MCVSSHIHVYTCMHTYLWYMYMIGRALLCIYGVQARGWCILGHFLGIFWHFRPYFMTGSLKSRAHCLHCPGWICKSTSPLELPASHPHPKHTLRLRTRAAMVSFYRHAGDLNSGPRACTLSTLPAKPSLLSEELCLECISDVISFSA